MNLLVTSNLFLPAKDLTSVPRRLRLSYLHVENIMSNEPIHVSTSISAGNIGISGVEGGDMLLVW